MSLKCAWIGLGHMGSALLEACLKNPPSWIESFSVVEKDPEKLKDLDRRVGQLSLEELPKQADWVFLCVKPAQAQAVLEALHTASGDETRPITVISVCAGLTTTRLTQWAGPNFRMLRVMPNLGVAIGQGVSVLSETKVLSPDEKNKLQELFSRAGKTLWLPEDQFDLATALVGSGPGFVFYLMDQMVEAAQSLGLPEGDAQQIVTQCFGAAANLGDGQSLKEWTQRVATPGGTTEAGLNVLKGANLSATFLQCLRQAAERSRQMGQDESG